LATPDAAAAIAGEIAQLLRHWLVNHIFQEDMLLKPLFAQQRR
jgi:hemerythrin